MDNQLASFPPYAGEDPFLVSFEVKTILCKLADENVRQGVTRNRGSYYGTLGNAPRKNNNNE